MQKGELSLVNTLVGCSKVNIKLFLVLILGKDDVNQLFTCSLFENKDLKEIMTKGLAKTERMT